MDNRVEALFAVQRKRKDHPAWQNGKHVKIDLGESTLLGFGAADLVKDREGLMGWVYRPRVDTWRNVTSLQLVLEKMVTA